MESGTPALMPSVRGGTMHRWVIIAAFVVLAGILASSVSPPTRVTAQNDQPGPTRSVQLVTGWNLVAWTGNAASVEDALGGALASVVSVNTFDASSQSFQTFTTDGPTFLNTLSDIPSGAGVWLLAQADATWEQPSIVTARDVPLVAGFNLVGWTGIDGAMAESVDGLGDALTTAFLWDAAAERFLTYGPAVPSFLNTAESLAYGDGLWVLIASPATWEIGGAPAVEPTSAVVSESGLSLVGSNGTAVEIAEGALTPGIDVALTPADPPILPAGVTSLGNAVEITTSEVLGRPAIVRLPIPAGGQLDAMLIYRVSENGDVLALATTVEDGHLVARTPEFSTFIVGVPAAVGGDRRNEVTIVGSDFLPVGTAATYSARGFYVSDPTRLGYSWQLWGGGAVLDNSDGKNAIVRGASTEKGLVTLGVQVVDLRDGTVMFGAVDIAVVDQGNLVVELSASTTTTILDDLVSFSATVVGGTPPFEVSSLIYGDGFTGDATTIGRTVSIPSHAYAKLGWFTVSLVVTDADRSSAVHEVPVEVRPDPIALSLSGDDEIEIPGGLGLGTASYVVTVRGGVPPFHEEWFATGGDAKVDGTLSQGAGDNTALFRGGGLLVVREPGVFIVSVVVVDGFGASADASIFVRASIVPSPIQAEFIVESMTAVVGKPFPFRVEWPNAGLNIDIVRGSVFEGDPFDDMNTASDQVSFEYDVDTEEGDAEPLAGGGTFWEGEFVFAESGFADIGALGWSKGGTTFWASAGVGPIAVFPDVTNRRNSGTSCNETEGSDFASTWQVALEQEKEIVTGTISFHACPGRGRVQYEVEGTIENPLAKTLTLNSTRKSVSRGPLGQSTPTEQQFVVRLEDSRLADNEPEPNLDPVHNLGVTIDDESANTILVERPATLTVTVRNGGPSNAKNVELEVFTSGVVAVVSGGSGGCGFASASALCSLGELPAGASRTLTVNVTPQTAGTLTIAFRVDAAGSDFSRSNNTRNTSVTVIDPEADVAEGS